MRGSVTGRSDQGRFRGPNWIEALACQLLIDRGPVGRRPADDSHEQPGPGLRVSASLIDDRVGGPRRVRAVGVRLGHDRTEPDEPGLNTVSDSRRGLRGWLKGNWHARGVAAGLDIDFAAKDVVGGMVWGAATEHPFPGADDLTEPAKQESIHP